MGRECARTRFPVPGNRDLLPVGAAVAGMFHRPASEVRWGRPGIDVNRIRFDYEMGVVSVDDRSCVTSGRGNVSGRRRYSPKLVSGSVFRPMFSRKTVVGDSFR